VDPTRRKTPLSPPVALAAGRRSAIGLVLGLTASVCGAGPATDHAVLTAAALGADRPPGQGSDRATPAQPPILPGPKPSPPPKPQRPWWDWLGITEPSQPRVRYVGPKGSQRAPKERPWWDWLGVTEDTTERSARGMPKLRVEKGKPWWDWLGVTEQTTKKRVVNIGRPRPQRPWWDWLGVTEEARAAPRPQTRLVGARPPQRPWWDWLGVTEGQSDSAPSGLPRAGRLTRPPRPGQQARAQQAQRPWWLGITDKQPPSKRAGR